jgi:four helix bundle protein
MLKGHRDLKVYQLAFRLAMEVFTQSKSFPQDERYSLTSQIRRSSRSVVANIAEGFRKRQYPSMFVSKLADSDAEATETQVWLDFARGLRIPAGRVPQRAGRRLRRGWQDAGEYDGKSGEVCPSVVCQNRLIALSVPPLKPTRGKKQDVPDGKGGIVQRRSQENLKEGII